MYFGSVRFFKNLILLVTIILIVTPTVFAFRYHSAWQDAEKEIEQLTVQQEDDAIEVGAGFNYETPSYQELYPDFYAPTYGTTDAAIATEYDTGTIYLTFDDGPSARTDEILAILEEKGVKATFFVTGQTDEQSKERMREIVAQGHTLGMHSYSHEYAYMYDSVELYLEDMYNIYKLIEEATGEKPTLFRFPGGSINVYSQGIYQELIAEMLRRGFIPYDWNMSAQDAVGNRISAATIQQNILTQAAGKDRGVVLLHDAADMTATVQALAPTIDRLREMGFEFDKLTPEDQPVMFMYQ